MTRQKKATPKVSVTEIAARINAHLKRFEADPEINRKNPGGTSRYWNASAVSVGSWPRVCYVLYQGSHPLNRREAERYLAWLDAGNEGKHWEMERGSR